MKNNKTSCKMRMIAFPSIGMAFLAAALLLLLPGRAAGEEKLNVPPEGFTALFNGKDFTGWRLSPMAKEAWFIEDGVLKSHKGFKKFGANLRTDKKYRDFVLLVDYRMPTMSDSGIWFRGLSADVRSSDPGAVYGEQVNIHTWWHVGYPSKLQGLPPHLTKVKDIRPEIGVWHTIKLTMIGRTLSVEVDGEVIVDEFEYPDWPGMLSMEPSAIELQKHAMAEMEGKMSDCPIEFRNVFIKEIEPSGLNVPPEGFTALFNGKDFTGWRLSSMAQKTWSIEDGVLKSHGGVKDWGADLATEKEYRDFVLLVDFRFPTISASGIWFRGWKPLGKGSEQFNLRSRAGLGNLDSLDHLPRDVQLSFRDAAYTSFFYCQPGYEDLEPPPVEYIDPEVGVWHTVKLTLIGKTLSAEYDGEIIHDRFEYQEGILSMEPGVIRLQKHVMTEIAGKMTDCPIEFRNLFIKELESSE